MKALVNRYSVSYPYDVVFLASVLDVSVMVVMLPTASYVYVMSWMPSEMVGLPPFKEKMPGVVLHAPWWLPVSQSLMRQKYAVEEARAEPAYEMFAVRTPTGVVLASAVFVESHRMVVNKEEVAT